MTLSNRTKIVSISELKGIISAARKSGKKALLSHGVFDLIHPGHILHFKSAREHGDILAVTITSDEYTRKGPGRPFFNQKLRMETIASIEYVDYVALSENPTAIEVIRDLKPSFYVKGNEYSDPSNDVTGNIVHEIAAVREFGGDILYTDEETFSSSKLINRYFQDYPTQTKDYLHTFRKKYPAASIIDALKSLGDLNVLVVGEAILDKYCYCQAMGKPPKDAIVSAKFESEETFAGGSLAVARHIANFCNNVSLVTYAGNDDSIPYIRSALPPNVSLNTSIANDRPTIVKRRFIDPSFLTKMFELQHINDSDLDEETEASIVSDINKLSGSADLIVVCDFGHGMFTERIREAIYKSGKFIALNAQTNSANMGFNPVTKYRRADFVSIDEPEIRLAAHSKYASLDDISSAIASKLETKALLVSRGPYGNNIYLKDMSFETPVFSNRIVDRTGAGDALFSIASPCVYKGLHPELVGFISNCVGALAVEIVCNRAPVDPTILFKFITYLLK